MEMLLSDYSNTLEFEAKLQLAKDPLIQRLKRSIHPLSCSFINNLTIAFNILAAHEDGGWWEEDLDQHIDTFVMNMIFTKYASGTLDEETIHNMLGCEFFKANKRFKMVFVQKKLAKVDSGALTEDGPLLPDSEESTKKLNEKFTPIFEDGGLPESDIKIAMMHYPMMQFLFARYSNPNIFAEKLNIRRLTFLKRLEKAQALPIENEFLCLIGLAFLRLDASDQKEQWRQDVHPHLREFVTHQIVRRGSKGNNYLN